MFQNREPFLPFPATDGDESAPFVTVVPEDSGTVLGHDVVSLFRAMYNELSEFEHDPPYRAGLAMDLVRIVAACPLVNRLMR